jgi:hypothetical protein
MLVLEIVTCFVAVTPAWSYQFYPFYFQRLEENAAWRVLMAKSNVLKVNIGRGELGGQDVLCNHLFTFRYLANMSGEKLIAKDINV